MPLGPKVRLNAALSFEEGVKEGVEKNVHYGEAAKQVMDIYSAAVAGSPLVLLIHGGGWVSGDKNGLTAEANKLNAQGFGVWNINYRWAGNNPGATLAEAFPFEVEDCQTALESAITNATAHNASKTKVFIVCGSAGGQLGAQVTIRMNEAKAEAIRGVTTLSGATDLWKLVEEHHGFGPDLIEALGFPGAASTPSEAEWAQVETPEKEALAKTWSPARHVVTSTKTTAWQLFESEGTELMPKSQYTGMKTALEGVGASVSGRLVPGTAHSYAYWPSVETEIYNFIKAH